MTQLTTKHTKELLDILENTKETMLKDHKTDHPHTQWKHKHTQIKQRLTKHPQYTHQTTQTTTQEKQKREPKPKLNLEKKPTPSNHTPTQQIQPHNQRNAKLFPPPNW